MRIIYRTLVLLAAALLVSGATYALVGAGALGAGRVPLEGAPRSFEGAPGLPSGARPDGPGRERRGGARLFAIGELLRSLAIIGVIMLLVVPLTRLRRRQRGSNP